MWLNYLERWWNQAYYYKKRLILNRGSDYDKYHSEPFDFYEIPKWYFNIIKK